MLGNLSEYNCLKKINKLFIIICAQVYLLSRNTSHEVLYGLRTAFPALPSRQMSSGAED